MQCAPLVQHNILGDSIGSACAVDSARPLLDRLLRRQSEV